MLPENPKYAEMRHGDGILSLQCRHGTTYDQRAADVRLFVFYRTHLSHIGKNNGNPDLVCEKLIDIV